MYVYIPKIISSIYTLTLNSIINIYYIKINIKGEKIMFLLHLLL